MAIVWWAFERLLTHTHTPCRLQILFQESLLKVLFATETFSMGINMPAKTVRFICCSFIVHLLFFGVTDGCACVYVRLCARACVCVGRVHVLPEV